MILLTKEQILMLHEKLIVRYGGTQGVRDYALLDSAVFSPNQTFDGNDIYPTVKEKAVRLCYGLVQNHPFHDGNKRIGALALLVTLDLNHILWIRSPMPRSLRSSFNSAVTCNVFIVIFSFYSLSIS